MPLYYYFLLIMLLSLIVLLIRSFVLRKKKIPVELFTEALKNENSGNFEAALITYESALNAATKSRVHGYLKNKITEKLKVLHTIIEYNNSLHIVR